MNKQCIVQRSMEEGSQSNSNIIWAISEAGNEVWGDTELDIQNSIQHSSNKDNSMVRQQGAAVSGGRFGLHTTLHNNRNNSP